MTRSPRQGKGSRLTHDNASIATESYWRLSLRLMDVAGSVTIPLLVSGTARLLALLAHVAQYGIGAYAIAAAAVGLEGWSIMKATLVFIALSIFKALMRYLEQFTGHFVAFRSLSILRQYFYDKLVPQSPAGTEGADSGDLMSRVTKDIDRVEVFFAHTLVPAFTAIAMPIIVFIYLGMMVSWVCAVVSLIFSILIGGVIPMLGSKTTSRWALTVRHQRGQLGQHVTDSVQGVQEVLDFGRASRRHQDMRSIENTIGEAQRNTAQVVSLRRGANQVCVGFCLIIQFFLASILVQQGHIGIEHLALTLGVTLSAFSPLLSIEDLMVDLDEAFAAARRVFMITEHPPYVVDAADARGGDGGGDIVVSHVSFRYPPRGNFGNDVPESELALDDINLVIPSGKVTAIVGASGSGKSTLAAILDRIWDPEEGSVTISGTDIRGIKIHHLRKLIAYAAQRPYVFNATIKDNLLLASPDATADDLQRVTDQVGLTSWLESEPAGIQSVIGEMGGRISGGQKQRLALARVLLRDAPFVILDEATSQLDQGTERQVLAGIREACVGKTLIVIAHRLLTVADADQIIVMDSGRVVESGRFDELVANQGVFTSLLCREQDDMLPKRGDIGDDDL